MVDARIVKEWLTKADEDFKFASASLHEGSEFFAQICFHFHQAVEKYLKTFIICKELPFVKVHDLLYLLESCASVDASLRELREDCILLNTAYIETRYPVHWPTNYTRETADAAMLSAQNVSHVIHLKLGIPA
jgi:HEPN domain-containing protein